MLESECIHSIVIPNASLIMGILSDCLNLSHITHTWNVMPEIGSPVRGAIVVSVSSQAVADVFMVPLVATLKQA
jgi:hypothetical protein